MRQDEKPRQRGLHQGGHLAPLADSNVDNPSFQGGIAQPYLLENDHKKGQSVSADWPFLLFITTHNGWLPNMRGFFRTLYNSELLDNV